MSNAKAVLLALAEQNIAELNAENAKLRDDLETQREVATDNTRRNMREYKRVCDENDQLRELVRRYSEYTDQDRCEGCVYKSRCNDGYMDECWQLTEIRGLARELGIEVPE